MDHLNHLHLLVTAYVENPPMTAEAGNIWLRELVDIVDMQILMDAQAIYCEDLGNEGVTGVVGLTTSHASFHSWHDAARPFVSFDIYSCRTFSVEKVFAHLAKWGMTHCSYMLIDRDPSHDALVVLDQGVFRA